MKMKTERLLNLMPWMLRFAVFTGTFFLVAGMVFQMVADRGAEELSLVLQGQAIPLHFEQYPLQLLGFGLIIFGPVSRLVLSSAWFFRSRERLMALIPLISLLFIGLTAMI